jgi:hypothetical protein
VITVNTSLRYTILKMLGVTNLTSLPEGVGEMSVDESMWNRERYSERTMENVIVYY